MPHCRHSRMPASGPKAAVQRRCPNMSRQAANAEHWERRNTYGKTAVRGLLSSNSSDIVFAAIEVMLSGA